MRILSLLPFFALVAVLSAQTIPNGTVTQGCVALLGDASIRKEVGLSKEQNALVQSEFKQLNDALKEVYSTRPKNATEAQSAQQKIRSLQLGLISRLQARLTTPQLKRLREIGLQRFGPFSMLSPEIQSELKLNSSQVGKIKSTQKWLIDQTRALQQKRNAELKKIPEPKDKKDQKAVAAYIKQMQDMIQKFGPTDRKTLDGYKKQAEAKVVSTLTAPQKAQWTSMKGRPFNFSSKPA